MSIENRVVEDDNGGLRLLPPGHNHTLVMAKGRNGTVVQKIADGTGATFSNGSPQPVTPPLGPLDSTVCTRSEAARILGLSIDQAAILLDANDVGKHAAYERVHVEAIAKARRDRKPSDPDVVLVEMPISAQPLVLEVELS